VFDNPIIGKRLGGGNASAKIISSSKNNKLVIAVETSDAYNATHVKEVHKFSGYMKGDAFYLDGSYESTTYYNPVIRQIGKYVNNLIEGTVFNYAGGKIASKYNYLHSRINGTATFYDGSEKIQSMYQYKNDTLNGDYSILYESGMLKQKGEFCKGIPCGRTEEYYKNGTIKVKGSYSGKYISSFKCDTCSQYSFYINKDKKIDLFKSYSVEFRKEFFGDFNLNQSNNFKYPLKQGDWLYYDQQGQIEKKEMYNEMGDIIGTTDH
jgi:antitoxin component YwqK of YwqJK toxin-antitoxin module